MDVFNVLWKRYNESKEYVVGSLIHADKWFFMYNKKVLEEVIGKGFRPFPEMPEVGIIYENESLFKTFDSRYKKDENISTKIMKQHDGRLATDNITILHNNRKLKTRSEKK